MDADTQFALNKALRAEFPSGIASVTFEDTLEFTHMLVTHTETAQVIANVIDGVLVARGLSRTHVPTTGVVGQWLKTTVRKPRGWWRPWMVWAVVAVLVAVLVGAAWKSAGSGAEFAAAVAAFVMGRNATAAGPAKPNFDVPSKPPPGK